MFTFERYFATRINCFTSKFFVNSLSKFPPFYANHIYKVLHKCGWVIKNYCKTNATMHKPAFNERHVKQIMEDFLGMPLIYTSSLRDCPINFKRLLHCSVVTVLVTKLVSFPSMFSPKSSIVDWYSWPGSWLLIVHGFASVGHRVSTRSVIFCTGSLQIALPFWQCSHVQDSWEQNKT